MNVSCTTPICTTPTGVGSPVRHLVIAFALAIAGLLIPATTHAQNIPDVAAPAHLTIVDGDVVLDRELDTGPADPGMPVVPGDRVRTNRGRAELLFPDGTALDVDEYSELELQSPGRIRLTAGRVRLMVARESSARYQVDTPAASATTLGPGEYRIAVLGTTYAQTELAVFRGLGELASDRGAVRLNAGERSTSWSNDVPSRPEAFNSARLDAFDRWAMDLRDERTAGRSGQYLPPDLRVYGGALDRAGAWEYESTYGYVWYPSVEATWRPYFDGYWTDVPRYGWTWIGVERWSWPTHHYGRWGYLRNRWFWIPERRFAPAWVSWGAAPGYVSWCPLGFDNRPVFDLAVSFGSPLGGWVVLPRDRFGIRREYVNRAAVPRRSLPARVPFVLQSGPPAGPPRSPSRRIVGGEPPRDPGVTRAPERGGAPGRAVPRAGAGAQPPARESGDVGRSGSGSGTAQPRARNPEATRPDAERRNPREIYRAPAPAPSAPRSPDSSGDQERQRSRDRAVPRIAPEAGAAQPSTRQYPFGDFRRPNGTAEPGATQPDRPADDSVRAPRSRPAARDEGAASGPASTTPAQPKVYVPPPAAVPYDAGRSPSTQSPSGGGAIGRSPRSGASGSSAAGGDSGRSRESGGGSGRGSGGATARERGRSDGQSSQGGSTGREHAPSSRRP